MNQHFLKSILALLYRKLGMIIVNRKIKIDTVFIFGSVQNLSQNWSSLLYIKTAFFSKIQKILKRFVEQQFFGLLSLDPQLFSDPTLFLKSIQAEHFRLKSCSKYALESSKMILLFNRQTDRWTHKKHQKSILSSQFLISQYNCYCVLIICIQ